MNFGLLGEKLGHSYSKIIHESFNKYNYNLIEIKPDALEDFFNNDFYDGFNVTIPYKQKVISFCDVLSESAKAIGAVNTVYHRDGLLFGDNTDYFGFMYMVNKAGIDLKAKKILILGTGGSSLMVQYAVKNAGASEVIIASRSGGNDSVNYDNLHHHFDSQVIINTTPVGMYPNNGESLISFDDFYCCEGAIDLIYNPLVSSFLFDASKHNIRFANGLSMLVAQAAKACELFTNEIFDEAFIDASIKSLEYKIKNIVLIGMPGCGKSTIGKLLAEKTGKEFIDTDFLIEEEMGLSIPQIFEKYGEARFRQLENEKSNEIGILNTQVISTGGGMVLNPDNMKNLSQNGWIIFLDRPIEFLSREGRPLSSSTHAILKMASERMTLYKNYSDYIISMAEDPYVNVNNILELLGGK